MPLPDPDGHDLHDRQRTLLAVLRARGPANASALKFHPAIKEACVGERPRRAAVEADLVALARIGAIEPYTSR